MAKKGKRVRKFERHVQKSRSRGSDPFQKGKRKWNKKTDNANTQEEPPSKKPCVDVPVSQSQDGGFASKKALKEMSVEDLLADMSETSDQEEVADDLASDDEDLQEEAASEGVLGDLDIDDSSAEVEEDEDEVEALRSEIEEHKDFLASLKESDPDFYKTLAKEEPSLLEFDEAVDDLEDDDEAVEEDDDLEMDDNPKTDLSRAQHVRELTADALEALKQSAAKQLSVRGLRRLVRVFRLACHLGDEEKTGEEATENTKAEAIVINNSAVFNDLLHFVFKNMDTICCRHLELKKKGSDKPFTAHPRWKGISPMIKSYLINSLHFFQSLTDANMRRFVLTSVAKSVRFLGAFPKVQNKCFKMLVRVWSEGAHNERIDAFLAILDMAQSLPSSFLEKALKQMYLTYVRNAKFTSVHSKPAIVFMRNCLAELYGLNQPLAYQFAFVYIRQMAIHLRNAITQKGTPGTKKGGKPAQQNKSKKKGGKGKEVHVNEHIAQVYNWQFINCLALWTKVLCQHATHKGAELHPLVYPLVQIILGVVQLAPSSRYSPLRLHCCSMLSKLARNCHVYIPVAPVLLDLLTLPELDKKPQSSGTVTSLNLAFMLHATPKQLNLRVFHENLIQQTLHLLLEYFAIFSYSVSFPELVVPCVHLLKRFCKHTRVVRFKKQANVLMQRLHRNADWIKQRRAHVEFAPKDAERVDKFARDKSKTSPLEQHLQLIAKEDGGDFGSDDEDQPVPVKQHTPSQEESEPMVVDREDSDENQGDEDVVEDFVLSDDE